MTLTLADFLLARIAEDGAVASRGRRHNASGTFANDNYGCLLVDPARVLAECEAKRRIVEALVDMDTLPDGERTEQRVTLRWVCGLQAAMYADHPDYREEWRP